MHSSKKALPAAILTLRHICSANINRFALH